MYTWGQNWHKVIILGERSDEDSTATGERRDPVLIGSPSGISPAYRKMGDGVLGLVPGKGTGVAEGRLPVRGRGVG